MESIVSIIQSLYSSFGLEATANNGDVAGVGISLLMIVCTAFIYFSKDEAAPRKEVAQEEVPQVEAEPEVVVEKPVVPEVSWKDRLTKGLSRSRTEVWGKLEKLFSKDTLDQDTLDEVEELLYSADIGVQTASEIIEALEERSKSPDFNSAEFKSFLKTFLGQILEGPQSEIDPELFDRWNHIIHVYAKR